MFSGLVGFLWLVVEIIVFSYFFYISIYNFVLGLFGLKISPVFSHDMRNEYVKIAVLVPAYKEDSVIESSLRELIKLDYPKDKFKIYTISDRKLVTYLFY